ncbi:MAG TPA: hypothetical protein VGH99_02865 [Pseudonocardia sp.]|jgi:hypothetical protein
MYELSRVRLFSVGPPGARYQDVCLDLRGVGSPVRAAAQQPDLFADDVRDRVPRRPSPASVLFLENGGGKSVLLKLVFSVLLPGRRQVVGTTNTRVLEKFVLGEDIAHVACEWMHTRTGERLVTGKVSEWRGHVVSSDPAKLLDGWYSFRPGDALRLDDLPFTADRRRVTMTGFRQRLDSAQQADPRLRLAWHTVHREWSEHLVGLGLDPELFRYQRAMNAGEGEAAEAFSFPTDEAFVDFLLRAVVDPDEPTGLAEVVAGYAAKIAQRAELEIERDFVDGTLQRLGPLAGAERAAASAREVERTARATARELAGSVAARRDAEADRLRVARAVLLDADEQAGVTEQDHRRLREVCTELRRRVAELTLRAAEDTRAERAGQRDGAAELVDAWQAVEPVLRDQLAGAEAARLRRMVAAEQEKARPALAAREQAAVALASALRAVVDDAVEAARVAGERAEASARLADDARGRELRWNTEGAEHRAAVDQAHTELGRIRGLVSAAVADGLLGSEEQAAAAADRAAERRRAATASVEDTLGELTRLRAARRAADHRSGAARAESLASAAEATQATAALADAERRHAELAAEPRLAELLGVEAVHPDADAPALLDRLGASLAALDDERTELRDAQQRDQRALRALGEGGLLPVPAEVEQALAVLETAGVPAHPGWRYLSRLSSPERAAAIERFPHLVTGVLLGDAGHAERARAALTEARLLPCALIAVAGTDALRAGAAADSASASASAAASAGPDRPDPGSSVFVVPPNPAMFDEAAAEQTRTELTELTAKRHEQLAASGAAWDADRALVERLRGWRDSYPPGALAELAEAGDRARAAADRAEAEAEEAAAAVTELDARSDRLGEELPELREAEAAAGAVEARLSALRTEVDKRGELTERVMQHTAAATAADAQARKAADAAAQAHREGQEHLRAQDRGSAVAATARDDLAELPTDDLPAALLDGASTGAAAVAASTGGTTAAGATAGGARNAAAASAAGEPPRPLSVLRTEYRRADAAYAAAEVNADLRAGLGAAEREAEAARTAVDALADPVRRRADALLRGPDGGDASTRRAAAASAVRVLRDAEARVQTAHTELALARRALEEYRSTRGGTAPYGEPADIEHGHALIERAEEDLRDVERAASTAESRRAEAAEEARRVEVSADGFVRLVDGLDEPPEAGEDFPVFAGDVNSASARWTAVRSTLRDAAATREARDADVRRAADDVARHAQDARFGEVTSPVRAHLLGVSRADMPGLADEWTAALRPRLRSLDDDLAHIGRHRSGIVTRLQGMVGEALRTLRLAQRLSELPDGLSDWSGQQFLRIRFDEVDDDTALVERLGEVVDETALGHTRGGKESRDGMSLLLRGVRAAMPRGVRVEMLKPDAVLRTERLRVSEIRDVFSGGQQLTAAIVLYCTMAALRANQRGEGGRPHAGVLFLDNPIGRASAGYLLELQFGVARALGVQLVYTTGLFDAGALSAFPLVVRLRNDADLRAGRKYLTVEDRIAQRLAGLPDDDGTGQVASARIFRRPTDVEPLPAD